MAGAQAGDDTVREMLRGSVEQLAEGMNPRIGGAQLSSVHVIPRLYEENSFRTLWVNPCNIDELLGLVEGSFDEGLDPEDYHSSTLRSLVAEREKSNAPDIRAALDLVLTDSLVRLGYHLFFGKVNPEALDSDWNLRRDLGGRDPVELVRAAIGSPSLRVYIDELIPRGPIYDDLKAALAEYRGYEAAGGWPIVPAGTTLKPGMEDTRIAMLRERLRVTDKLTGAPPSRPNLFDPELERAVRSFQGRHKLDIDGAVGPETLAALNVPVEVRIDQIRVNLERARWVLRNVTDDFVVVNIAGFRVWLVRDGEAVWTTRAQVGKQYRMTPVFASMMKYMVFNPTWTVPPGILSKDILPKLRKDPVYLGTKHLRVIDGQSRMIDPQTIDFSSFTARTFPYQIRQDPGPWNALGQVKFIFPNPHFVFLHDTPSKAQFERRDRTFSSGCIRTENPLELAELLLDDPEQWNQKTIQEVLDGKKSRTVFLPEPVPVLVLYWTVIVGKDGQVLFLRDVYDRDGRILKALGGDFEFDLPPDLRESLRAG
jgi:murein L,D-transpeptidase YcbB/YkuD